MEQEHDTPPATTTTTIATPAARVTSPWGAAITCSAVLALLISGALFAMQQQLRDRLSAELERVDAGLAQLTTRLSSLEAQTATLAANTHPESTALDALNASIAATNTRLGELTARLDTLEKKQSHITTGVAAPTVEPVATTPLPASTLPSTTSSSTITLAAPTPSPAPTITDDAPLRAQLLALLATLPPPSATGENATLINKLNARFTGFIAIKKQNAVDVYAPIRAQAETGDLATIAQNITQLNDAHRQPLEGWIASYRAAHVGDAPLKKKGR